MRIPGPLLAVVVTFGLIAAACGPGSDDRSAVPTPSVDQGDAADDAGGAGAAGPAAVDFGRARGVVVANTAGTITTAGPQRVMTAIVGPDSRPFLGGPGVPVLIAFQAVDEGSAVQAEGTWLTTNATALGLYVSSVDFPAAGQWEVVVSADGAEIGRTSLTVTDESAVPGIGDRAPATDSPTGTSPAEIEAISTDPEPDPALYGLSIAEAVGNGRPTMIAFATPAFCQTALCGPTLEAVKAAAAGHADLDVVHVEPFDIESATAGDLRPVPAMAEWGLQTEPWVFVIGADGVVRASFEGIVGQGEIEAALDRLDDEP